MDMNGEVTLPTVEKMLTQRVNTLESPAIEFCRTVRKSALRRVDVENLTGEPPSL
jgi:hypothetical protein